jgi:hypothetical protein
MTREEIAVKVLEIVESWRDKYELSAPESLYQRDDVQLEWQEELGEKLLDVVGYFEIKD